MAELIALTITFEGETIGSVLMDAKIARLYEKGQEVIFNPMLTSRSVIEDEKVVGTDLTITGFNAFVLLSEPSAGPTNPHLNGTVWECSSGHECYVSAVEMRLSNTTPVCNIVRESGLRCESPLIRRLGTVG